MNDLIVKICGVTRSEDAVAAAEAGADWMGLNFWSGSPRCVTVEASRAITNGLGTRIKRVGVFVNASSDEMQRTLDAVALDFVQLHGEESSELAAVFGSRAIKALRLKDRARLGDFPAAMVLLDADVAGYGGAGVPIDWEQAREIASQRRVLLAGGLKPENVAEAVRTVRPAGVDVASGVEQSLGIKDPARMRDFVAAARGAMGAQGK